MFKDLAYKFIVRNKKTSLIFGILNLMIVFILITSISLKTSLSNTINELKNNYSTIGVVEYVGKNYPNDTDSIEKEIEVKNNEFKEYIKDKDIIYYDDFFKGFVNIESEISINSKAVEESVVAIVSVSSYVESKDMYYCLVTDVLYSPKQIDRKLVLIDSNGIKMISGCHYVVHGKFFYSGPYASFGVCDFELYDYQENTKILDIEEKGLEDDSVFYKIANTYKTIANSLNLISTNNIEDVYEINQGQISLQSGEMPKEGECLISSKIAGLAGYEIGDVIKLNIAYKSGVSSNKMYDGESDFDDVIESKIAGIFNENEEFDTNLYLNHDFDFATNNSYTLGQIKIENGTISEFSKSLSLPESIKITYYDQGYEAIADGLDTMLDAIKVIVYIAIFVSIVFVVLYGYLLTNTQAKLPKNMIRLGTTKLEIYKYFGFVGLFIGVLGVLIGCILGVCISGLLLRLLVNIVDKGELTSYLYSNSIATITKAIDNFGGVDIIYVLAASIIFLILDCLVCVFFANVLLKKNAQKQTNLHILKTKSHLKVNYSYLSFFRNGFKSFTSLLMVFVLTILYINLPKVVEKAKYELEEFKESNEINVFFTSYDGSKYDDLVVDASTIKSLQKIEYTYDYSCSRSGTYRFLNVVKKNGDISGPGLPTQPIGGFAQETYLDFLASSNKIVATNNVYGASDFVYSSEKVIFNWLDGYNNDNLSNEENNENIFVISKKLAKEYNIELGDYISLEVLQGKELMSNINYSIGKVIGIYMDDGSCSSIFTAQSFIVDSAEKVKDTDYYVFDDSYVAEYCTNIVVSSFPAPTYKSAAFKVNGKDVEKLKSELYELGYSEPRKIRQIRQFVLFNDSNYLKTIKSMSQKIWYMEYLFPVVYLAGIALSFILGFEAIKAKKKDMIIMHNIGVSKKLIKNNVYNNELIMIIVSSMLMIGLLYYSNSLLSSYILMGITSIGYLIGGAFGLKKFNVYNRKDTRGDL